jgi:hypothetical protein
VILYSENRRVLEAEEFGFIISVKDYYNFVRKMVSVRYKLQKLIVYSKIDLVALIMSAKLPLT